MDYAFLITAESNDVTSLGHDFSADAVSADEQVYFAGYPADTEDGTKLIWSSGTRNPQVTELFHVATNPLTSGSSGGPWLTRDSDGNYKIVGLTSHGKPTVIPGVFSPILDEETAQLLAKAESALNGESAEHTVHVEEAES